MQTLPAFMSLIFDAIQETHARHYSGAIIAPFSSYATGVRIPQLKPNKTATIVSQSIFNFTPTGITLVICNQQAWNVSTTVGFNNLTTSAMSNTPVVRLVSAFSWSGGDAND